MKAMVRDDIIDLETFVKARFEFDEHLRKIHDAGGYAFLIQFDEDERWRKCGGKYLAQKMAEAGLLKMKLYSNTHKFCYLSSAALKYLILGDSEKDYSEVPKNKISVKNLSDCPTEKQLFSSAIKFSFPNIGKSKARIFFESQLEKIIKEEIGENASEKDIEGYKASYYKEVCKKWQDIYDISKILIAPFSKNSEGRFFEMIIIDYGKTKTPAGYFKIHNDFKELLPEEVRDTKLKIHIASYSMKRANALFEQFEQVKKDKEKALNSLKKANSQNPNWVKRLKRLTEQIPEFDIKIIDRNPYYLETVKARRVSTQVIKPKDAKALEQLQKDLRKVAE